jgi:hypothetical protein
MTAPGPISVAPTDRWAGYLETPGAVSEASATWVVPSLTCPSTGITYASTWVGVGGFTGGPLLQAGMYDTCLNGFQVHGAFGEEYPGSTNSYSLLIRAGDTVTATVEDTSTGWEAEVTDDTTGEGEIGTAADYTGGTSAEWEVEAYGLPTYPLTNFGSEAFTGLTVNGSAAAPTEALELVADDGSPLAVPSNPAGGVYQVTYE